MENLSEFEQLAREYSDQSGDAISDNAKGGGIKNEKLADHLGLNASRLTTYAGLKGELKTICSAQRRWAAPGAGGDGVAPAQVDALGKGSGKRGQKGKGKADS